MYRRCCTTSGGYHLQADIGLLYLLEGARVWQLRGSVDEHLLAVRAVQNYFVHHTRSRDNQIQIIFALI